MQTRDELYECSATTSTSASSTSSSTVTGSARHERGRCDPRIGFKPKKSVALSGVIAGNTAICTVGRTGNDLHYRGYDILDIAESCEFEEIAYLLIHEKLPESRRTRRLQAPLEGPARPAPAAARRARAASRRRRTRWTCCARACPRSAAKRPKAWRTRPPARARRRPAGRLAPGSMLCYWHHFSRTAAGASRSRRTTTRPAGTSCTCCTASRRRRAGCGRCTPR